MEPTTEAGRAVMRDLTVRSFIAAEIPALLAAIEAEAVANYRRDLRARVEENPLYAADRALAIPHGEDDQPCGCDECMSYGAEDEGFDWARLSPARRIALRVFDSGDERFAPLVAALREHEAAIDEGGTDERPA